MDITPQQFQTLILNWFDQYGRKHLPWQQNKTPYRVWVSEIMLQQTQVNTVIPYFERFMQAFPDLMALANAERDQVLHLWAGLGYYSRARNLHSAAVFVKETMGGALPGRVAELQTLPGIGPSTAGAISAIAFNERATILDGNVKRVLARLHGIFAPVNEKNTENELWALAEQYTPKKRVADYTQAIMDLGATLCTRSKPECPRCPLLNHCSAYQQNCVESLPTKKMKRELPLKTATLVIFKYRGNILLYQRPAKGIWCGLWSLPEIPGAPQKKAILTFCKQQFKIAVKAYQPLSSFRHTFTHYHLDIHPILIDLTETNAIAIEESQQIWYNPREPVSIGLPKPIQSIMRSLL